MESSLNKKEGEGEREEERGGDGLKDSGKARGRSLFTIHVAEQWRMQKTDEGEGEGEE
jgi:hypothetical protein